MNPFLHATVAQPIAASETRHRASRRLRQGLLALGLSTGLTAVQALDINLASVDELQGLKGLGRKTAALIVSERQQGGPYLSFDDVVDRVKGVGVKRLTAWQRDGLIIAASPAAPLAATAPVGRSTVKVHTNMPVSGRGKAAR